MKLFVVSCLLVGAAQAHDHVIKAKWSAFKAEFGKTYSPLADAQRLKNYMENDKFIQEHNAKFARGEVDHEVAHNHMSDMSDEEFRSKMLGRRGTLPAGNYTAAPPMSLPSLPEKIDWRDRGIVTPAKNQQGCGSCYAFGTLGGIESAIAKRTGQQLDLSEQQIVDCSYRWATNGMNSGCQGGHEAVVLQFVKQTGVVLESQYPYRSGQTGTHYACSQRGGPYAKGIDFRQVAADEGKMAEAIATLGTLVVPIAGENQEFKYYKGWRIFDNPACPMHIDHVVSIVGYGTEGGIPYWIVKNSWGTGWGENGFARIRRGVNRCAIGTDYSWAVL